MTDLLIVCPMALEAKAVVGIARTTVATSGPGPDAMRRWLATVSSSPRLIVLAGLAGGLAPTVAIGRAKLVDEVIAPDGRRWRSPVTGAADAWRVAGVDHLVASPAAKRALAARSNADIVDMESHVFAEEAARRGWRWCVVRGVGDTVDDHLPPGLEGLVDSRGRARPLKALALLARRPMLLPTLRELGRRAEAAMVEVRTIVARVVAEAASGAAL